MQKESLHIQFCAPTPEFIPLKNNQKPKKMALSMLLVPPRSENLTVMLKLIMSPSTLSEGNKRR